MHTCKEYAQYVADEVENCPDLGQYLNDCLDIEDSIVWVMLGGPTCCIDVEKAEVRCSWGQDFGSARVDVEVCENLKEYLYWI